MLILTVVVGFSLLIMGRQLFWVSVAGLGFLLGINYATQYFQGRAEMILLISLGAGLIGAVLAFTLQRAAAGLIGFLAGWYLATILITRFDLGLAGYDTIAAILGGIMGVFLISILMDWSLIILSCLSGAVVISQSLTFRSDINLVISIILFVLGVAIQAFLYLNEKEQFK
jgi:hypothetical protein